jgi:hypothetical protein
MADEIKQDESLEEKKVNTTDVDVLFSGEGLSEEFKNNAKAIFEAAVLAKVEEQKTALEEEYNTKLVEEAQEFATNLVGKIDEYLEYVVSEYMEENKLAIEKGIRAELAEDFMLGLKNLFTEHYIDIPEEKVNVVEEFANKVGELEEQLDKIISEKKSLSDELDGLKKDKILGEVSEGLSEVQSEKLKSLAEGIEFVSEEDYKEKLSLTKKKYFSESTDSQEPVKKNESLDSDVSTLDESFSPVMNHYVQNLSKFVKK